nr:diacylglycerol acyltransferase [Nannochloropsis oceanica strain IMET1]
MTQVYATGAHNMPDEDRLKVMNGLSKPLTEAKPGDLGFGDVESMTFCEEFVAIMFLLIIVGSMLWIPIAVLGFALYVRSAMAWVVMLIVFFTLSLHPVPRIHDMVHSPLNHFIFKYFSLKMASDAPLDSAGRYIFVAPPHGVLPMGNLMTVHAMKACGGLEFRGLTTDVALRLPLFRHYLGAIGTIAATRHVAKQYLDKGWSIGISSGGVAEIFEVNNKDEVVLMKERKGFVKLALRTGTPLVACYIFGNTKLLSAWYDDGGVLEGLSRYLKCGVLPLWGRFGLPLMHRHPVLGAMAKPIVVPKVEGEPTQEMIDEYHSLFCQTLVDLFDRYKTLYGWPDKKLLIK